MLSYRLYIDNSLEVKLDQSLNFYQLSSLTFGRELKVKVSAVNEVGEGPLSKSNSIVFANVPSSPA